jgi:CubicO group peptidase (beta-lactamase class C family)
MLDTTFRVTEAERLATPYVLEKGVSHRMGDTEIVPFGQSGVRFQPSRATDPAAYPSGGAGMSGTAGDYMKFLEAIRMDGGRILRPATARAMTSNQIGAARSPLAEQGWGFGFGAAVLLDPEKGKNPGKPGFWRWGGVYGTNFFVDRKSGLSVVVLTNTTLEGMNGQFPAEITRAVYAR